MLIKKIIAFAAPIILLAACTPKCIEDSGNHIEKSQVVKNFDKIEVLGAMKLILVQDSSYSITISADSNLIGYVKADVSSGRLKLKLDEGKYCGTDSIVIRAGIGELKELKTGGAVKVLSKGRIYASDIDLNFAGTFDAVLDLSAGKMTTRLDGVGKLSLSGQAGSHQLITQGTAEVNAFDFISGVYDIEVAGSAKANINVLNELKVKTEGSSEIYYKGNPKNVKENKSGATKLEKVN
ncbi:head GIN domain-containing protein [Pedobacter metabolipauper]|uniref:Putative autotransporter adhesin-like protein n=1 Tax=Pedobacter metabolipauper TaxID=425513 RepID=A0A4R6T3H4_9SPHI|nr:head GIN domain-containing protein [Pedobacter metabolipauper]TDQ12080.1 putative autotransporter adhesin-like protein [Pedobacter metabolipauper]